MESFASDISSECLVTDLVNELSSGLEIPFLLRDDISLIDRQDSTLYDLKEKSFIHQSSFDSTHDSATKYNIKNEIEYDLSSYWQSNEINCQFVNPISGSNRASRSGSECSSTEIWMIKNELDTPPVTPPDERISPDNTFLLSSDELKFIPIIPDDNPVKDLSEVKNLSHAVRIQPKLSSDSLNIIDSQESKMPTIFYNAYGDINSNTLKTKTDSHVFINANKERKKAVLSRKDLELQAKRKQERMIRNRESAYLSRKRKKEHVALLEKQVKDLITENSNLRLENYSLRQRLANYEEVDIPPTKSSKNIFKNSPRKATALFALLFTFCLNFGSFSSLINEFKWNRNEISQNSLTAIQSSDIRHARSLLWAETEFKDINSTFSNSTITICPAYINQSESIRLESELRKWIGGEDDYSGAYNNNVSKLSQYFYTGDKPQIKKESSKMKKRKKSRSSPQSSTLEMDMYKMKSNLFNFDTFFEAIHRRDDTFYLVSFSGDHLLLPALSHNQTSRPKMSLMLPAFLSNVTGVASDQVEMMQIDCEVTNTQVLSVNENNIPSHMRPLSNFTTKIKRKITQKAEKYEFFMNNEDNFLSLKQNHLKDNGFSEKVKNYTSVKSLKKPVLKVALSKLMKFQQPGYNFNTINHSGDSPKTNYSKDFFEVKILDSPLANQNYRESGGIFENANGKSLLKMLMVNSHLPGSKIPVTNVSGNNDKT